MILTSAPQDEAILSNVGEIGEFRIRNSAKAFSILSSGLYANKIRAIIRELSCNAVDSHIAAGKGDTPFDVHLPTQLEPWFSIRDYGTGLDDEQIAGKHIPAVVDDNGNVLVPARRDGGIYNTYFESTKTGSNDFIGALGLGSKSPFSYTNNFTVTAVKDGRRGIYSAFINDMGVPSIVLMMDEQSTEPNGVEVKFSVNGYNDFEKFKSESRHVYIHFKLRPVIHGVSNFKFYEKEYREKDILPGIHYTGGYNSVAVMGNIEYPIEVPQSDTVLGELRSLLDCGLELHFDIGELDFQASREGLSYIPDTVQAIKRKLAALNTQLTIHLAADANKIKNSWERALFLSRKRDDKLFRNAAWQYAVDTTFPLANTSAGGFSLKHFNMHEKDLAKKYNIEMKVFVKHNYQMSCKNQTPDNEYSPKLNAAGQHDITKYWGIYISETSYFVLNDTKPGGLQRTRYHWLNDKDVKKRAGHQDKVFVVEPVDKKLPIKFAAFLKAISNPPAIQVKKVSDLMEKPRAGGAARAKNVTILKLERKDANGGYHNRRNAAEMVWRDAGKADSFDTTSKHYYLPIVGHQLTETAKVKRVGDLNDWMKDSGLPAFATITIHGVRKADIDWVKTQKNWVNLEDYITATLTNVDPTVIARIGAKSLDSYKQLQYNARVASLITDPTSPYLAVIEKYRGITPLKFNEFAVSRLVHYFAPTTKFDGASAMKEVKKECEAIYNRYPVLGIVKYDGYTDVSAQLAQYINLVDRSMKLDREDETHS